MERIQQWFGQDVMDNSIGNLLLFAGIILLGLVLKRILSTLISQLFYQLVREEASLIPISSFIRLMRQPIEFFILLLILYVAFDRLSIPSDWHWAPANQFGFRLIVYRLYQTVLMVTLTWIGIRFIKFMGLILRKKAEQTESRLDDQLVPFIEDLTILGVGLLAFFATLSIVYNVNVVALVTSLGIGGLAIALAARETLENLFASFAILLDRPFVIGDTVTSGTGLNLVTGTVEKIGFRSTRLRTDDGSLIAVPNRLMISQALDNLSDRTNRRAKFILRLALDTSVETIRGVVEEVRLVVDQHPMTHQNQALIQFDGLGENSLDILVQYYVATGDYREFNRIKEEINYRLVSIVQQKGGQFAFPVRIVYLSDRL